MKTWVQTTACALALAVAACTQPAPQPAPPAPVGDTGSGQPGAQPPSPNPTGTYPGDPYADRGGWPPITSDNYAAEMERQSHAYGEAEYKPIFLQAFVCADNCYVRYQPDIEGGGDAEALCSAPICGEWERAGGLPAAFKGKRVGAKFGTGPQVDGSGRVMRTDFRRIEDFRFPGRDGPAPARPSAPTPTVTTPTAGVLPLRLGVYVDQGVDCANPPNAAFRVYDGQGVSGSATRDCRLSIDSSAGGVVSGRQSCVDTYSGARSETPIRLTVRSQTSFTVQDGGAAQTLRRCEPSQLRAHLRQMAPG